MAFKLESTEQDKEKGRRNNISNYYSLLRENQQILPEKKIGRMLRGLYKNVTVKYSLSKEKKSEKPQKSSNLRVCMQTTNG